MNYKIIKEVRILKNKLREVIILNTKSNKEYIGFIHSTGIVEILRIGQGFNKIKLS